MPCAARGETVCGHEVALHPSSHLDISVYLNYTDKEIRDYYSGFESTSYANRCVSLWMTAYIMPDGVVRPSRLALPRCFVHRDLEQPGLPHL